MNNKSNQLIEMDVSPFAFTYSPNMAELLLKLNCSIAISTYQAGKLIFISPQNEHKLIQLPRTFKKPMGIAIQGSKMAIATQSKVITFQNSSQLAQTYPIKPRTYDALFLPRCSYHTGYLDLHDIHFGKNQKIWAINTHFSCLCTIDDSFNFNPIWKPHFISKITSGDRCHLNGLAMENGVPKFATALGQGDTPQSWRTNITTGGVVIDIPNNEIICDGLGMPHSPLIHNNKLYVLLSADQKLICIDPESGEYETVAEIPGFLRGMTLYKDVLFIATSKLRKNSSTFKDLPFSDQAKTAGIVLLHLPTATIISKLEYLNSVDEIYDVQILPNIKRPNILNTDNEKHEAALMIPNETFWGQKK